MTLAKPKSCVLYVDDEHSNRLVFERAFERDFTDPDRRDRRAGSRDPHPDAGLGAHHRPAAARHARHRAFGDRQGAVPQHHSHGADRVLGHRGRAAGDQRGAGQPLHHQALGSAHAPRDPHLGRGHPPHAGPDRGDAAQAGGGRAAVDHGHAAGQRGPRHEKPPWLRGSVRRDPGRRGRERCRSGSPRCAARRRWTRPSACRKPPRP